MLTLFSIDLATKYGSESLHWQIFATVLTLEYIIAR